MKLIKYILPVALIMTALNSCATGDANEDTIPLEGIEMSAGDKATNESMSTRAGAGFAVNTSLDPTYVATQYITNRPGWLLDVQIYKGGTSYGSYGKATCDWNATLSRWVPRTVIHFPNYTRQAVSARLYPDGWTAITADQGDASKILSQDVMVQNGTTTVTVYPAHIPTIPMKHANSMLNFRIADADFDDIEQLTVVAGGVVYTPYHVAGATGIEYMVILPVGTVNPQIKLKTKLGARYTETINISGTQINTCYCATLQGIQLLLSSITVNNWVYGEAIAAEYTTVTSYPTFRGPGNETYTVMYDNNIYQEFEFNSRGEVTVKPWGRTITWIGRSETDPNGLTLDPPIVIRSMVIDLEPFIEELPNP